MPILLLCEFAFLSFYYRHTGLWLSVPKFLASFQGCPPDRAFSWNGFLSVWVYFLASTAVWAAWMFLAWFMGRCLIRNVGWRLNSVAEVHLASLGLGLGCLSLTTYMLCATHVLSRGVVIAVLAVGGTVGVVFAKRFPLDPRERPAGARPFCPDAVSWLLLGLMGLLFIFHVLGSFLPPVAFDEMNYQLALPKLYAMNKGFVTVLHNHLSFLPKNINMLFILGLLSGGHVTAKLFSLSLGVMAVISTYEFGRQWVGRMGALAGAAFFALTPVMANQFRLANTDLGTGFYELMGIFLVLRWQPGNGLRDLLLAAIFWGLALGSKYTALPGFCVATVLLSWRLARNGNARRATATLSVFVGVAFLLWSPWLLLNLVQTGNPFTPLFTQWFHSRNFEFAGLYQPLVDYAGGLGISNYFRLSSFREISLFPWHLISRHNDFNHFVGPLWFLAILTLIWEHRRLNKRLAWPLLPLVVASALYWVSWLVIEVRMTRYFVAGLGITSLLAGWAWSFACEPFKSHQKVLLFSPFLLVFLQQSLGIICIQNTHKKPWNYLVGRSSLSNYLDCALVPDSPFPAFQFMNERLPPRSKVLLVNEFRPFYLDRNFRASTPWDHDAWHEMIRLSASAEDLGARLKSEAFTHIFINQRYVLRKTGLSSLRAWTQEDMAKQTAFLPQITRPLFSQEGLWVGEITSAQP